MPAVSLIVPVYNVENYLRECLASLCAQTFSDFEVICVDDGSTDGSAAVLDEFAARDGRFQIIRQVNAGQGAARNRAIDLARGTYVEFVDADDALVPDALETLVKLAESRRLDHIVFSADVFADGAECVVSSARLEQMRKAYPIPVDLVGRTMTGPEAFRELVTRGAFFVSPCLRFIRRDVLADGSVRFAEGLFLEDTFFTPFAVLESKAVELLDRRLYRRRLHGSSTMTDPARAVRRASDARKIWRLVDDRFTRRGDVGVLRAAERRFTAEIYRGFLVQDAMARTGLVESVRRLFCAVSDMGVMFAAKYVKRALLKR